MSEHLQPPAVSSPHSSDADHDGEQLRILSRSPHPYHRQSSELLEPSDRLAYTTATSTAFDGGLRVSSYSLKDSTPASESGTEADDEHFLKGLPAPKARLHKGLRGKNEPLSGSSTPLLSPAILEEEGRKTCSSPHGGALDRDRRNTAERIRRRKELVRRGAEILLLGCQAGLLATNHEVQPLLRLYRRELLVFSSILAFLVAIYPLRLVLWGYRKRQPTKPIPVRIPTSFDLAPLLYPSLTPVFVSLLVGRGVDDVVLLNVFLALSSLPRSLIPSAKTWEPYSAFHWLLSCAPCFLNIYLGVPRPFSEDLSPEILVLIYPLHQTLCMILRYLTTTSLLDAELQLLSTALINVLLLAHSPQVVILKAILWGGGLGLIISCSQVIRWGISLARVPKWRFRRPEIPQEGSTIGPLGLSWLSRVFRRDRRAFHLDTFSDTDHSVDGYLDGSVPVSPSRSTRERLQQDSLSETETAAVPLGDAADDRFSLLDLSPQTSPRRYTLPISGKSHPKTTPSGRRKRSASYSVRAFFSLTQGQATVRKWMYAGYVYLCIAGTIFVGIREYVQRYALSGREPIGWALGYLFGDLPWFRFQVVQANLEKWICLPERLDGSEQCCSGGWVQHIRAAFLGEANTRLVLSAYCLAIIIVGLAVVFQLSPIYEVDTRRKVFHFMMVAMFLPSTFVDPAFVALALSLVLAIFLLLDLLRASQLPPLSKPIATFLTPYVDGRDLRGPVVISHIFLLIGCAIPLWLSLASQARSGSGCNKGWEVPTRDVSMVAGVVCVGLGDAAASLIGRRWGHRKWLWGGGKSIEGSVAFATAVFVGLMGANLWLRVGGWPVPGSGAVDMAGGYTGFPDAVKQLWTWLFESRAMQKTALCASMASLTEAVLTGGNDNVVVPVVLWTCVKSLGI
ncbi:hypothetical protein QBC47DRAFT_334768 [Echria macrotheca]|uniref:dolichol kinase n=1 Tax=Echria macrotheca TaxID=438768 RepID=A0AAJ0BM87_9PEZI|nr:hypothetical protein QBC47DRAFT_334768 [Echria macrotheca]